MVRVKEHDGWHETIFEDAPGGWTNTMPPVDRNISFFDDSKRMLAKLMAMENLTVQIIAGAPTASFDPVTRVLTLPDWPQLSIAQIDTQIGHEVGHALFTDHSYLKATAQARKAKLHPGLHSYINVVEDCRIERKMRESYPGMKATFYEGRLDFAKKGPLFQIADAKNVLIDGKKSPVKKMPLIDRINLFYKIGAFIDIPFAENEWQWMDLIDKSWSTERAIEIAKMLHELAKDDIMEQMEQQKQRQQMTGEGGEPGEPGESSDDSDSDDNEEGDDDADDTDGESDDRDSEDADGDGTEGEETDEDGDDKKSSSGGKDDKENGKDSKSKKADGKESKKPAKPSKRKLTPEEQAKRDALDPASATDNALEQALKQLGEDAKNNPDPRSQIRHLLLKPVEESVVRQRTIPAKDWANDVLSAFSAANVSNLETRWNNQYLSTAENMASEFLRRKTAKNLMHARVGRTGRLDMNKLARYQFADDIFKRVMTVPNGQSHGIVMMIDGSSSMSGVFPAVLDQVLLFAHFAFRASIPFEAYMFNDQKNFTVADEALQTIVLPTDGHLVGLVNTVSDRATFKRNAQALLIAQNQFSAGSRGYVPDMHLGGTPLYAGMMLMERHVARMKKTLHLDKVMSIVISDGDDNSHLYYTDATVDRDGDVMNSKAELGTGAFVVRDMVTKKNHTFVEASTHDYYGTERTTYRAPKNAIITMLFDIMRSRHDSRNIYMYLVSSASNYNHYGSPAMGALTKMVRSGATMSADEPTVRKSMTDLKQFVLPVTEGVADCAIVVEPDGLVLRENDFANWNSAGVSQEQVSKRYIDSMQKAVANRTFVNSVVPFLV